MTPTHKKVLQCIGLLGSAIRCLTSACRCDRVAPLHVHNALEKIYIALQILIDNGSNPH